MPAVCPRLLCSVLLLAVAGCGSDSDPAPSAEDLSGDAAEGATATGEPAAVDAQQPEADPAPDAMPATPAETDTAATDDGGSDDVLANLPGDPVPEGVELITTASGLSYAVLAEGDDGANCALTDAAHVRYTGYFEDGRVFDGTADGAPPARFPVGQLIPGFTEALQMMRPGSKLKVHIPWQIAYGEKGSAGGIPPRANLVFDIELVEVERGPEPLSVPQFSLPGDDELTDAENGLRFQHLEIGSGTSPTLQDTVTVHYAGWLTDGTPFDDSYSRGEPTTFPLRGVISGWQQGLQLMQAGGTALFVIPPELAYGANGTGSVIGPNATLVFQVELISVNG